MAERKHPVKHLDNETSGTPITQKLAISVEEMAQMLSVSRPVAYDLTRQEGFPCFRLGKRVLVNVAGLQRWLDEQTKDCA